eukprot:TRINITY_DN4563_c0_g1_i1.p1 TRINITY_DN4563_c0_g1~~TRINITY_DN4563_c0_g1_i1.p1  ORF type:complete len:194 (-),score=58.02 TRINITY_DN4563_c0_g1_i1:118-699(-)
MRKRILDKEDDFKYDDMNKRLKREEIILLPYEIDQSISEIKQTSNKLNLSSMKGNTENILKKINIPSPIICNEDEIKEVMKKGNFNREEAIKAIALRDYLQRKRRRGKKLDREINKINQRLINYKEEEPLQKDPIISVDKDIKKSSTINALNNDKKDTNNTFTINLLSNIISQNLPKITSINNSNSSKPTNVN